MRDVATWAGSFYKDYLTDFTTRPADADLILINICRNKHWVLVSVDVKKKKIRVYDSELNTDYSFVKEITENLIYFLFQERDWEFKPYTKYLQPRKVHCGVYNLLFMKKIMCKPKLHIPITEEKLILARYKFALEILNEKILY